VTGSPDGEAANVRGSGRGGGGVFRASRTGVSSRPDRRRGDAAPSSATRREALLRPTSADAARYYQHLKDDLQAYGEQAFGWHYGVWDGPLITTRAQALLRSCELLVDGLRLTRDSHVLDVGCGLGSLAVWVAHRFGCRVTGVTICDEHVPLARDVALGHGLEEICRFSSMDMGRLEFEEGTFDAVFNQDSFCYAGDKARYLADVHRVLKAGGAWRAVAFGVQPGPLAAGEATNYEEVRSGFEIPDFLPAGEVESLMERAGFSQRRAVDITSAVLPTAREILGSSRVPLLMARLHLDWLLFSTAPERRRDLVGHYRAGRAYSRGLLDGCFRHCFYSGTRGQDARG